MTQREMRGAVRWTVEDPPVGSRARHMLTTVLSTAATVATLGTTTGARGRPTWAMSADPDAYVDIGKVQVRGTAPWLPARPGARHRLRATSRAVVLDDGGGRRTPTQVPLAELHIARARPRGAAPPARHPDAQWTLTLSGAGTVEVDGAWLALAWIGLLAGWPEPRST